MAWTALTSSSWTVNPSNGRCNASTSTEATTFYFEVDAGGFEEVLDIFAQFFVGTPRLESSMAERELHAVDAEDSRNRLNDTRRYCVRAY